MTTPRTSPRTHVRLNLTLDEAAWLADLTGCYADHANYASRAGVFATEAGMMQNATRRKTTLAIRRKILRQFRGAIADIHGEAATKEMDMRTDLQRLADWVAEAPADGRHFDHNDGLAWFPDPDEPSQRDNLQIRVTRLVGEPLPDATMHRLLVTALRAIFPDSPALKE